MTKDEALKLALEALESSRVFVTTREKIKHPEGAEWYDQIITAIKEALAQPEQEPVVFWDGESRFVSQKTKEWDKRTGGTLGFGCDIALYTTPPQRTWVGLTDEDFLEACQIAERGNYLVAFQRIQAKLKEKNT